MVDVVAELFPAKDESVAEKVADVVVVDSAGFWVSFPAAWTVDTVAPPDGDAGSDGEAVPGEETPGDVVVAWVCRTVVVDVVPAPGADVVVADAAVVDVGAEVEDGATDVDAGDVVVAATVVVVAAVEVVAAAVVDVAATVVVDATPGAYRMTTMPEPPAPPVRPQYDGQFAPLPPLPVFAAPAVPLLAEALLPPDPPPAYTVATVSMLLCSPVPPAAPEVEVEFVPAENLPPPPAPP